MVSFCPLACLQRVKHAAERVAVVILNKDTTLCGFDPLFHGLWKRAVFRACVDGGANFVYDVQQAATNGDTPAMPDVVTGDFDSIRPEVKEYYENHAQTIVTATPNQDETDFTKCIRLIGEKMYKKQLCADVVVAIGGNQDRFDHSMANANTLYKARDILPPSVRICIFYGCSYLSLLPEGKSVIKVDTGLEGAWCGLVPIGRSVAVTTTGLRWNLSGHTLGFGQLVSTSNELDGSPEVLVETDQPLIWTMEFKMPQSIEPSYKS